MSFGDKVEQHTYKHGCVEVGKSPMEIKQLLERHIVVAVFQSLCLSMTHIWYMVDGIYLFHNSLIIL